MIDNKLHKINSFCVYFSNNQTTSLISETKMSEREKR